MAPEPTRRPLGTRVTRMRSMKVSALMLLELAGVTVTNLGDTLLLPDWEGLEPNALMVPIGGPEIGNTMGEDQAA